MKLSLVFPAAALCIAAAPAAAFDLETVTTLLEQAEHDEMSPLGMFMAADWVVKGVMLSLLFASALVWVIFVARVMILRWERGVLRVSPNAKASWGRWCVQPNESAQPRAPVPG